MALLTVYVKKMSMLRTDIYTDLKCAVVLTDGDVSMKSCDQELLMLSNSLSIRKGQMEYRQVHCQLEVP